MVKNADIVSIIDASLILYMDVKSRAKDDAVYIVNTSFEPEFIKEKINIKDNIIYTVDASKISCEEIGLLIPNLPMMTLVMNVSNLLPMGDYKRRVEETLSTKLDSDLVLSNMRAIDRALNEVKKL